MSLDHIMPFPQKKKKSVKRPFPPNNPRPMETISPALIEVHAFAKLEWPHIICIDANQEITLLVYYLTFKPIFLGYLK